MEDEVVDIQVVPRLVRQRASNRRDFEESLLRGFIRLLLFNFLLDRLGRSYAYRIALPSQRGFRVEGWRRRLLEVHLSLLKSPLLQLEHARLDDVVKVHQYLQRVIDAAPVFLRRGVDRRWEKNI